MVKWFKLFKDYFSSGESLLPSGCVASGHRFSSYSMCSVCGEYKNDRS